MDTPLAIRPAVSSRVSSSLTKIGGNGTSNQNGKMIPDCQCMHDLVRDEDDGQTAVKILSWWAMSCLTPSVLH